VLVDNRPIGVAMNRNLGSPTAPGEAVEAELNRLIERRSRQKDPEEESALWQASVRQYNARREAELKAAWCEHHEGQAARLRVVLAELIADHEQQAERYRDQTEGAA
jgi:hypothetical protein